MDKESKLIIYQEVLDTILYKDITPIVRGKHGICILLGDKLPSGYMETPDDIILEKFPEFELFRNQYKSYNDCYYFSFPMGEDGDDLRIFALQLCIEMTKDDIFS